MALFRTCVAVVASSFCTLGASAIVNGIAPADEDHTYDAVAAFSFTAWIDGETFEHNTFGNAILIEPDKVLLARHLISSTYNQSNQPDEDLFSVRFRRHLTNTELGTQAAGWQSYHQVKIKSWIFAQRESGAGDVIIGVLSQPVTHITPIPYDPSFSAPAGTEVTVTGWGFESYAETGPKGTLHIYTSISNSDVDNSDCAKSGVSYVSGDSQTVTVPANAGQVLFDSGGGVFMFDASIGGPTLVGSISTRVGAVSITSLEYFHPVLCCDAFKSSLFNIRQLKCPDINNDSIVDGLDLGLVLGAFGTQCSDINNCPTDLDWDGDTDSQDMVWVQLHWNTTGPCSTYSLPLRRCSADFNADGFVDGADQGLLLGAWGDCGCTGCDQDLNRDGVVDGADLGLLFGMWGAC